MRTLLHTYIFAEPYLSLVCHCLILAISHHRSKKYLNHVWKKVIIGRHRLYYAAKRSIYTYVDGHTIRVRNSESDFDSDGFFMDLGSIIDRRGLKINVSFDLSASCVESSYRQTSNISRTMKLGRIDSVPQTGLTMSLKSEDEDESSTISFHVSTKYNYTLTFTSVLTLSRGKTKAKTYCQTFQFALQRRWKQNFNDLW